MGITERETQRGLRGKESIFAAEGYAGHHNKGRAQIYAHKTDEHTSNGCSIETAIHLFAILYNRERGTTIAFIC